MDNALHITDKTVLKWVFDTYYKPLVIYSKGIIHSETASEDVVQDIFIDLYKNKNHFENEIALRAFLYKTTRNKCLNIIKHKKVKDNYVQKVIHESDEAYHHELETQTETVRLLHSAIEQLPERRKQIVKLYVQGLRNTEIAEKLNINIQTVKNLKSKAYEDLRIYFKNSELND